MIKLTTGEISEAVADYFACDTGSFDEWMKAHDAEVRMDAIIARDTRTPADLIQAAWDAAYPVPEGRDVPPGVPIIARRKDRQIRVHTYGWLYGVNPHMEVRTLEPLPPVIPEGTPAVWASSDEDPLRSVWIRDARAVDAWVAVTVLGEVMRVHTNDLIDPKPVPEEES